MIVTMPNEIKSLFKKLDGDVWWLKDRKMEPRIQENRLYYQPFDGCSIDVRLEFCREIKSMSEITVNVRRFDKNGIEYVLYWWQHKHTFDVWKLAEKVIGLIESYAYLEGENENRLDIPNLDLALKSLSFSIDYEDVLFSGKRIALD